MVILLTDLVIVGTVLTGAGYLIGDLIGASVGFLIGILIILVYLFNQKINSPNNTSQSYLDSNIYPVTPPRNTTNTKNTVSIQFEYKTKDGRKGTYTVDVYKLIGRKFFGYCQERDDTRSFFPESIINGEVVIVDTGEVVDIYQWLSDNNFEHTHNESTGNTRFNSLDEFTKYVIDTYQNDSLTIQSAHGESEKYGSVGIFKKFKSGKLQKHPLIYLEFRNSARAYLVSGKCYGKSYSKLDDAATYFDEQASILLGLD